MNQRLINCHALVLAQEILDRLGGCLRQEERRDAFEEFYRLCQLRLESYETEANRMHRRLYPFSN